MYFPSKYTWAVAQPSGRLSRIVWHSGQWHGAGSPCCEAARTHLEWPGVVLRGGVDVVLGTDTDGCCGCAAEIVTLPEADLALEQRGHAPVYLRLL
ncbi:MAG: hypothetical protein ACPGR8_13480 [Limisphaerales bacterium]